MMYQLTHLTRERGCLKHDDRLDCLAHAIAHVQDAAGVNSQEAHDNARLKEKLKAIDDLLAYSMTFSFDKPGTIPSNYQHKVDFSPPKQKLFFNRRS